MFKIMVSPSHPCVLYTSVISTPSCFSTSLVLLPLLLQISPPFTFKYLFPKLWILHVTENMHSVAPNAEHKVDAQ